MNSRVYTNGLRQYFLLNGSIMRKSPLFHAIPILIFVSGLFYYWFAVANRYIIFLYNHYKATPFDGHTIGRYLMTGLVASGAVMVLYTIVNWYLARIARLRYQHYAPPIWKTVWLICAIPLTVSILYITVMLNQPTLPWPLAIACTVVTLAGLALALPPAAIAVQQPQRLVWLTLTGTGLIPSLLLFRAIELPVQGLDLTGMAYMIAIGSTLAGIVWLVLLSWLQASQSQPPLKATELFIAGSCLSYLVLPLIHYLLLVPPQFRYISAAANFFAVNPFVQFLCFGLTAYLAHMTAQMQQKWK